MTINIKKLVEHAEIKKSNNGLWLVATDVSHASNYVEYGTGLSIDIPKNKIGLVVPHWNICNTSHVLTNSVEVIKPDNYGEIVLRFRTDKEQEYLEYSVGDIIGELIIVPCPEVEFQEIF